MAIKSVLVLGIGTLSVFLRLTAAEPSTNDLATTPTLYVVNYSHLDDQWRWSYQQTIREFLPYTLHTNFRYFEKYPHHIFNFPGVDRYRLMEEYYPDDFATLKTWVAKGRWVPNGNTWVENDTLAPSSETDIRQILMGYHYVKKNFGTEYSDFILPDSFGFPACLPSIIAHCGLRGFSTQKLTWKSAIGIPFNVGRWVGPDGRWVIAALNAGDYAKPHPTVYSSDKKMLDRLEANRKTSGLALDYIYNGRGDRGGAPYEISLKSMEQSYAQPGPVRVIVDQGDAMFRAVSNAQAEKFPSYTGELLLTEHSTGTITSQAYMKRLNRLAEIIGDASERASVAAELLGAAPYPTEALYSAWGLALRNQFHDAVPGTSVPKAYEYAWNDGIIALNQFGGVFNDAVGALARGLDTQVPGLPLVVFNPLSFAREDTIDLMVPPSLAKAVDFTVFDAEGKALATQVTTDFNGQRHVIFIGRLPAVGCAVFSLEEKSSPLASELSITNEKLENNRYRVGIDADGDVASIFDKKEKRELLKEPIRLQIIENFPEKKPAWHIDWKDIIKNPRSIALKPSSIRIVENGPVRVTIESQRECEGSFFIQRVSLSAGKDSDRIDLTHRMDWKTSSAMLKQNFVFTVSNPIANYCGDLGIVQRGNRHEKLFEVPNHQWINLTDKTGDYGITLLTGAKYGSDKPNDESIRLTLQHTPQTNEEENEKLDLGKAREQRWQDWGRHEFSYGIVGHAGDWRAGDATWQAHRFEHKSSVFTVPKHAGELGRQYSLMNFTNAQVVVQAIKRGENTANIIVRLQECHGKPATGGILNAVGAIQKATECDGLERPLQGLTIDNGTLKLDFTPYQLRTIALEIAPGKRIAAPASEALSLPFNCDIFSPNDKRDDGSFDLKRGDTYPAEMIGDTVSVGGINFKIGSRANGELNALSCEGQELSIPAGTQRLHLLVASEWKRDATFDFGGKKQSLSIADWGGYLGSWDNRVFIGEVQDLSYSIRNDLARIDPAWIRHDRVAWFASHYHTPPADIPYNYCYLFAYQLNVPEKATTFKLPKIPAIRLVAVNAASVDNTDIQPLWSWSSDLARDEAFKKRFSTP